MRPNPRLALAAVPVLLSATVVAAHLAAPVAAATGAFGSGTPQFVTSAAPSTQADGTFLQADNAGEPSIGVDWRTGAAMYMAGTDTYRLTFDNSQDPPAVAWTDVSSPYSMINLDPILATDHATGTTLAGGDDGACAVMSETTTDGAYLDTSAWTPSTPCQFTADHPTVGMGPYAGTPPVNATAPFVTYFCQQTDVDECSHSVDGGLTWSPSVPDPGLTCLSLFGHVKVSADGTAYVPSANCVDPQGNLAVGAIVSNDNGQTLTGYGIPGAPTPARGFDPSIATTPDNTVYETWSRAGDYHPVVTWSHDHGATWAPQVDLADTVSPALTAATFEAAVGGDDGRVAIAYLGTRDTDPNNTPFDGGFQGAWYLFVSYTYDGGQTWQTVQVTTDPVQRGGINDGGTTASDHRNLLDFMDASATKDGRVVVAYADGCITVACTGPDGTPADSNGAHAMVAYQSAGQGLFAAYDVPSAPAVTATSGDGQIALHWTTPAIGADRISGYRIYRGTAPGAESPYLTVPVENDLTDTAVAADSDYYYRVAAVSDVGVGAPSPEESARSSVPPAAPSLSATTGKGQVTLTWTVPADGGSPITGYAIYRATSTGAETLLQTVSAGTSYVDTGVNGGTTYYYEVAAVNRDGTGARSAEVAAKPRGRR